jgi:tRNA/rRNA methyltransferase
VAEIDRGAPAVVLVETSHPENLGAAARVLANFGLGDLRLVAPQTAPDDPRAVAVAAAGARLLASARVFPTLDAALADRTRVWATTALERTLEKPVTGPRALGPELGRPGTALVFGPERTGLRYEHLERCDGMVHIPTEPECRALNLAQAVGLLAWEWRSAGPTPPSRLPEPAPRALQQELLRDVDATLERSGWRMEPNLRVRTLRNLHTALLRAGFTTNEVRTLRGLLRALARAPRA